MKKFRLLLVAVLPKVVGAFSCVVLVVFGCTFRNKYLVW